MNSISQLTDTRTRVLLVEDDQALREGLTEYLSLKGLDVSATGTAAGFYELMAAQTFHVAVIDLGLPDAAGETLVDFARINSTLSLIVITANDGLNSRVNCYQSGADLFMGKPVQGQELAAAITSLAARQQSRDAVSDAPGEPVTGGWQLCSQSWSLISPAAEEISCTVKEYRLLYLLAEAAPEPVRRPKMLQVLYGRDDESAQRALDTLVRRLRKKIKPFLGQSSCPIRTVYSVGYLFADEIERVSN